MRAKGIIRGVVKIVKFHETMARPFIEKANRINESLAILKDEKIPARMLSEINQYYQKSEFVQNLSKQRIEDCTQYPFKNPDLLNIIFLYKEISKIFNEVHQLVLQGIVQSAVSNEIFSELEQVRETMMTLAFIGDSALELAVIRNIWQTENQDKIPLKGTLDQDKKFITEGKNQATLWDFLELYDSKILVPPPDKSPRLRSSLFEAVFGIIYLEGGLEAVEAAIQNLKNNFEKRH